MHMTERERATTNAATLLQPARQQHERKREKQSFTSLSLTTSLDCVKRTNGRTSDHGIATEKRNLSLL